MKGWYYKELTEKQKTLSYEYMKAECSLIWIDKVFEEAWEAYTLNKFKYDGATFVRENRDIFWEVASFIHDWLNIIGYVGTVVDLYFLQIMFELDYPKSIQRERYKWMQWTFLNVLIHKVRGNYIGNTLPKHLEKDSLSLF